VPWRGDRHYNGANAVLVEMPAGREPPTTCEGRLALPQHTRAVERAVRGHREWRHGGTYSKAAAMDADPDKVDEAVLALLYLTLHDRVRAWKSFDWDVMNRLHDKGFISDPVAKTKSVVLTETGLLESERLFKKLFAKD
jgi:Domain of unknown function (DUF6429)